MILNQNKIVFTVLLCLQSFLLKAPDDIIEDHIQNPDRNVSPIYSQDAYERFLFENRQKINSRLSPDTEQGTAERKSVSPYSEQGSKDYSDLEDKSVQSIHVFDDFTPEALFARQYKQAANVTTEWILHHLSDPNILSTSGLQALEKNLATIRLIDPNSEGMQQYEHVIQIVKTLRYLRDVVGKELTSVKDRTRLSASARDRHVQSIVDNQTVRNQVKELLMFEKSDDAMVTALYKQRLLDDYYEISDHIRRQKSLSPHGQVAVDMALQAFSQMIRSL